MKTDQLIDRFRVTLETLLEVRKKLEALPELGERGYEMEHAFAETDGYVADILQQLKRGVDPVEAISSAANGRKLDRNLIPKTLR